MSEFRFILNGQVLQDHPDGWQDFTETIMRDEDIHGITLRYEATLTFHGDGYGILEDAYQDSYCAEMNLIVEQKCEGGTFQQILDLLLKVTDVDTNLNKCVAEAKLTDSGYFGMIHNNRELSIPLNGEMSKNGEDIAPCPTVRFKVFLPRLSDGKVDYMDVERVGYEQKDALEYALRYMTDGAINEVKSDYLDSLTFSPNAEVFDVSVDDAELRQPMGFALISGYNVRIGGAGARAIDVRITFKKLIDTLFTKHGLFWTVENGIFRLEPVEYFYSNAEPTEESPEAGPSFIAEAQPDIMRSVNTERLYAAVNFGSEEDLADRELVYAMPFVDLLSHQQQRYNLTGVCNTETVLDLVSGYSYDSNVIEKIIKTQIEATNPTEIDQSKDGDVLYIQYFKFENGVGADDQNYAAFSTFFLRPDDPNERTGIVFNPYLFNSEISKRHSVQSDYSFYITNNDDNFKVSKGEELLYNDNTTNLLFVPNLGVGNNNFLGTLIDEFGVNGIPDLSQGGWGGFMNNSATNMNYPVGIEPFPIKAPFTDDVSGDNFNPNGNWDIVDRVFTAPATGVYGFDVRAIVNKLRDQCLNPASNWVNTNTLPNHKLIRARYLDTFVFAVYYDENDDMLDYEQILPSNIFDVAHEFNFTVDKILRHWPNWNFGYLNNNPEVGGPLWEFLWDYSVECTPSWNDSHVQNVPFITHMDAGHKMAIMVYTRSSYHLPNGTYSFQRRVRYGLMDGSYIKTTFFLTGGGEFAAVDVDANFATTYGFERPTTIEEWLEMRSDPKRPIYVSPTAENFIKGYPYRITRNFYRSNTEFEIIGNRKQNHH